TIAPVGSASEAWTAPSWATEIAELPLDGTGLAGHDSTVQSGSLAFESGEGAVELLVGDDALQGDARSFVTFDLAAIPAGSTIHGAALALYRTGWRHAS